MNTRAKKKTERTIRSLVSCRTSLSVRMAAYTAGSRLSRSCSPCSSTSSSCRPFSIPFPFPAPAAAAAVVPLSPSSTSRLALVVASRFCFDRPGIREYEAEDPHDAHGTARHGTARHGTARPSKQEGSVLMLGLMLMLARGGEYLGSIWSTLLSITSLQQELSFLVAHVSETQSNQDSWSKDLASE